MNLTGHWKGEYTYGEGYPDDMIGRSDPFEFNITDTDGIFTGTCTDEIVTSIPGNSSSIEGVFSDSFLSFIKRYKYNRNVDDPAEANSIYEATWDGVHYTGHLIRKWFSRKVYFEGEWTITAEFRHKKTNETFFQTCEGTWTMSKINVG